MKKTFREKVVSQCTRTVKKHALLKMPMLVYMTVILSVYYACMGFVRHGKRLASVCVVLLFFLINSSFNFHDMPQTTDLQVDETGVQLAAEETAGQEDPENYDIIEDLEVLEGYDDAELEGEENPDTYTLDDILEENQEYLDHAKEEADTKTAQELQFDRDDWRLMLVNKQHPIPEKYEFPLGTIKGNLKCDERIIEDLLDMMQAAKDSGVDLVICSPYRDYNRQTILFNRKIDKYMNKGLSYMEAYKIASQSVTAPNASEHQMGLAIDFYSSTYMALNEGFAKTETGKWLAEHSSEYGFILRYPKGKEYITGIEFEPWHFRYVGVENATFITEKEITLEEFWEEYLD